MKFKLSAVDAVRSFCRLQLARVNYVKKMVAIATYDRLSRQAPVLTGRYRWGMNCSLNGIDYTVPAPAPKEYAKSKEVFYQFDAERAIKAFVSITIDDSAIISNSLPYAEALENGHSKQAPSGVFRVVVPQIREDVKKWAALAQGKDGGF